MAESSVEINTPTKVSKFVNISPSSKEKLCVICGTKVLNASKRRKLFFRGSKTDRCLLTERVLDITLSEACSSNIICLNCFNGVERVKETVTKLQELFKKNQAELYKVYGSEVTKRLRPDAQDERPLKESRRKSLFSDIVPLEEAYTQCVASSDSHNVKVYITTSDGIKRAVVHPLTKLAYATTSTDFTFISQLILTSDDLKPFILRGITNDIQAELAKLCSKTVGSSLRISNPCDLLSLSWKDIAESWKLKAPTFWSILETFITNPTLTRNSLKTKESLLPGIVSSGAKLLSLYNLHTNAILHLNSIILLKGGAKKSAFNRLVVTHDSTSYETAIRDLEKLAKQYDRIILQWKLDCEKDCKREQELLSELNEVEKHLREHGSTPNAVLYHAETQRTLRTHQQYMHPGYYVVGDNVDFYIKVRHMSSTHQNVDQHMFQMCAYKNRVSGNHLDDTRSQQDAHKVLFSTFLPSENDETLMLNEYAYFVAKIWTENVPCFYSFASALPAHLTHRYMNEMKQKSERLNLGVLEKNEAALDQMTDILEFLHKFVPGHCDNQNVYPKLQKVLAGGDYLTFERHKSAQTSKNNGRTPSKRLQGLVPKIEEFHNQAELLKLIWNHLYDTTSADCVGTLHSAKNKLNARNVPSDPHNNFYAASDFMDKVTIAYVIAGGLKYFQMAGLHDRPTPEYERDIGNCQSMRDFIMLHAAKFVEEHGMPKIDPLPKYGPQSSDMSCRYCGKKYTRSNSLRKHEANVHNHPDPKFNDQLEPAPQSRQTSSRYDYTKLCLTLGLLRLNHNDSIKLGDGDRMMRLAKYMCLFYRGGKCPKYAHALLETIVQAQVLLSKRQAERLIWNRTVNHRGHPDTNHPNDLDLEHCNKIFKEDVHTYRGKYTEKTVLRVSRSCSETDKICRKFDTNLSVRQSSGRHRMRDARSDTLELAEQLHNKDLFNKDPTLTHETFKTLKNPIEQLNMEHHQEWILKCLKVFAQRMIYKH